MCFTTQQLFQPHRYNFHPYNPVQAYKKCALIITPIKGVSCMLHKTTFDKLYFEYVNRT